ncbi:VanZ family protein, partial [Enterocloster clostridioformis]|uniref:VanZ family protein n=1 Tax=Enterocloster clostridioformis TaxID=1531 RepID=UPI001F3E3D2C
SAPFTIEMIPTVRPVTAMMTPNAMQLVFKVGSFDVDDMFLNTLGAAAGYLCYRLVQWTRCKLRKRRLSR